MGFRSARQRAKLYVTNDFSGPNDHGFLTTYSLDGKLIVHRCCAKLTVAPQGWPRPPMVWVGAPPAG